MKVLFVLGGKRSPLHRESESIPIAHFIKDQAEDLNKINIKVDYFRFNLINKYNIFRRIKDLNELINANKYDVIHAHYGLWGFVSLFKANKVPLITTFHGSDINIWYINILSSIAARFSRHSIFVSEALYSKILIKPKDKSYSIIPCGIDLDVFYPIGKIEARKRMHLDIDKIYILFSSHFDNKVKNYPLALSTLKLLPFECEIVELAKMTREEVNWMMNSVDCLLLTSLSEGSPQVIKEALLTNLPIVSVDVGDVRDNVENVMNCYVAKSDKFHLSDCIKKLKSDKFSRTNGREKAFRFDKDLISSQIGNTYEEILKKRSLD